MSSCCRLCLPGPQKGTESHLSVANELEQTRQGSQGAQHTCKQEPHHCTAAHSTARQEANTHKHAISGAPHADRCHSQAPHARPGTAAPSAAHPVPAASQWRTQQNPPRHPRRHQRLHRTEQRCYRGLSKQLRCNGTPYREATTAGSSKRTPPRTGSRRTLSGSHKTCKHVTVSGFQSLRGAETGCR